MSENINTREYWENRFSSNDWEDSRGRWQTEQFAREIIKHLKIPFDFSGTILDFGCGLGDAIPIYKKNYPNAQIIGIDISGSAIDKCNDRFGEIADFIQGDIGSIPSVDIIISSNVLEHLTNHIEIAKDLIRKCNSLYIAVPYKEFPLCNEHVNSYDETSFRVIGNTDNKVFPCMGWTQYGLRGLYWNVYVKNIFKYLTKKPVRRRNMQILYSFNCE